MVKIKRKYPKVLLSATIDEDIMEDVKVLARDSKNTISCVVNTILAQWIAQNPFDDDQENKEEKEVDKKDS